jgi:hypothetical protein
MFTVILRSTCVGIASVIAALAISILVGSLIAAHSMPGNSGDTEVGWDLLTIEHTLPIAWILLPMAAFAIGFCFGFRHFSRSLVRK